MVSSISAIWVDDNKEVSSAHGNTTTQRVVISDDARTVIRLPNTTVACLLLDGSATID